MGPFLPTFYQDGISVLPVALWLSKPILKQRTNIITWNYPPRSNSHHQDYEIFSRESRTKPSFVAVTGQGVDQNHHTSCRIFFGSTLAGDFSKVLVHTVSTLEEQTTPNWKNVSDTNFQVLYGGIWTRKLEKIIFKSQVFLYIYPPPKK